MERNGRHGTGAVRRLLAALLVVVMLGASARPAAAMIPVIDAPQLAGTVQVIVQFRETIQTMKQIYETAEMMSNTIGRLANGDFGAAIDLIYQYNDLVQTAPRVPASLESALNSPSSIEQWVQQNLYLRQGEDADTDSLSRIKSMRALIRQYAVTSAFAVSVWARSRASGDGEKLQQLAQLVGAATSVRHDVSANSAILIQMAIQLSTLVAISAVDLEMRAASQLAGDGNNRAGGSVLAQ